MQKTDVWREAEALGLPADELKESQEICFVSHGDYRTFLEQESPQAHRPGRFVDGDGRDLGEHEGIAFYTPGQRRGLGVATGQRLYVQKVEPMTNVVVLGPDESLYSGACEVGDLHAVDPELLKGRREVEVKVRYATPASPASIDPLGEGALLVRFHHPQRALTPGQSAVFYEGSRVLGGGIIGPVRSV
jgi:tRNA-specific 2-thiouridylase